MGMGSQPVRFNRFRARSGEHLGGRTFQTGGPSTQADRSGPPQLPYPAFAVRQTNSTLVARAGKAPGGYGLGEKGALPALPEVFISAGAASLDFVWQVHTLMPASH